MADPIAFAHYSAGAMPPPHVTYPEWRWEACETEALKALDGACFMVEIRVNPSGADLRAYERAHAAWQEAADALNAAAAAARDALGRLATMTDDDPEREATVAALAIDDRLRFAFDDAEEKLLQVLATRIRRWNAQAADDAGHAVPIPPPVEAGTWEALYAIERDYLLWLVGVVRFAHRRRKDDPKGSPPSDA